MQALAVSPSYNAAPLPESGIRMEDVMSIVPLLRPLPSGGEESASMRVAREAFELACTLIEGIAREVRVRRDMNRLAEFDDHMLHDIGIARTDIEGAVRRGHD